MNEAVINSKKAVVSEIVEKMKNRVMVADTDRGVELKERIGDLKELMAAYRRGDIKEHISEV